mgnify:CR=1 FL=1
MWVVVMVWNTAIPFIYVIVIYLKKQQHRM